MSTSLIDQIVLATGLPELSTKKRLVELLKRSGVDPNEATIDDVKSVIVSLLQDLILSEELL